jgi:hypothetical protein
LVGSTVSAVLAICNVGNDKAIFFIAVYCSVGVRLFDEPINLVRLPFLCVMELLFFSEPPPHALAVRCGNRFRRVEPLACPTGSDTDGPCRAGSSARAAHCSRVEAPQIENARVPRLIFGTHPPPPLVPKLYRGGTWRRAAIRQPLIVKTESKRHNILSGTNQTTSPRFSGLGQASQEDTRALFWALSLRGGGTVLGRVSAMYVRDVVA